MAKVPNTTTAPTGNIPPFGLRMLPDLRAQIEAAAKASGRSMNAEIVARLQESFEPRGSKAVLDIATMQELAQQSWRLQSLVHKADELRPAVTKAWAELQDALKRWGADSPEALLSRDRYDDVKRDFDAAQSSAHDLERQISEIHWLRKASGMKELRDVVPAAATTRIS